VSRWVIDAIGVQKRALSAIHHAWSTVARVKGPPLRALSPERMPSGPRDANPHPNSGGSSQKISYACRFGIAQTTPIVEPSVRSLQSLFELAHAAGPPGGKKQRRISCRCAELRRVPRLLRGVPRRILSALWAGHKTPRIVQVEIHARGKTGDVGD